MLFSVFILSYTDMLSQEIWKLFHPLQLVKNSGSQPGVRVPQGVREKSQGVREIQVLCRFEQYLFLKTSEGVRKFLFLCLGVREQKRLGTSGLELTCFSSFPLY